MNPATLLLSFTLLLVGFGVGRIRKPSKRKEKEINGLTPDALKVAMFYQELGCNASIGCIIERWILTRLGTFRAYEMKELILLNLRGLSPYDHDGHEEIRNRIREMIDDFPNVVKHYYEATNPYKEPFVSAHDHGLAEFERVKALSKQPV